MTMRYTPRFHQVVVGAVLVLGGCSKSEEGVLHAAASPGAAVATPSTSAAPGAARSACQLVTAGDMSTIVGAVVAAEHLAGSGSTTWSKIVGAAMGSDAAGFIELVTSSGMSASGMSAFTPCTRTDFNLLVRVGASAQAFGKQIGKMTEEIFRKRVSRVNPPGTKLCDGIS